MKELQFSIEIQAGKDKVWNTLWKDETFRDWAGLIDPGTYIVGELKEGNEVQYISAENGYGVTSLVAELTDGAYVLLKHQADTQEFGEESRDEEWTGGNESYLLTETDGITVLTVAFDIPPTQEEYFTEHYPRALHRIKELAEQAS